MWTLGVLLCEMITGSRSTNELPVHYLFSNNEEKKLSIKQYVAAAKARLNSTSINRIIDMLLQEDSRARPTSNALLRTEELAPYVAEIIYSPWFESLFKTRELERF